MKASRNATLMRESYKSIRKEYEPIADIFREDDERVHVIKQIIEQDLTEPERIIITMYADLLNYHKLARLMKINVVTLRKEVIRIRTKIIKIYEERWN